MQKLQDIDDIVKSVLVFNDYLAPKRIDDVAKAVKEQLKKLQKIKNAY